MHLRPYSRCQRRPDDTFHPVSLLDAANHVMVRRVFAGHEQRDGQGVTSISHEVGISVTESHAGVARWDEVS